MRFIVDTFLPYDTGGPEALVQLGLALHRALNINGSRVAFIWRKKVHKRMWTEYPGLAAVPTITGDLREKLKAGDVIIAPDIRTDACRVLTPNLTAHNATLYTYLLSSVLVPQLARAAARQPQRCKFISHSHWLSSYSSRVSIPEGFTIRPYISPSIVKFCQGAHTEPQSPVSSRSLVLVDSDSSGDVRMHAERACNRSQCTVVRVIRKSRLEVQQLLLSALVVIDWCMVGTERLPVEAALCGAVLLTSDRCGGADTRDFPVDARNRLHDPSGLPGAIARIAADPPAHRAAQSRLVALYGEGTTPASMGAEALAFSRLVPQPSLALRRVGSGSHQQPASHDDGLTRVLRAVDVHARRAPLRAAVNAGAMFMAETMEQERAAIEEPAAPIPPDFRQCPECANGFCSRKRPPEPTSCYLWRHRHVSRINLSAAIIGGEDGSSVVLDAAAAQEFLSRRRVHASQQGQQQQEQEEAEEEAAVAAEGGDGEEGLFFIVSHRHTLEYQVNAIDCH